MTPLSPLLLWECQISSYQLFAVRSSPLPAVALFISHHTDSRTDSWHSSFHFNVINKIKHDQTHVLNRAAKTAASWSWKITITKRKPTVFVIEERKTYSVNWRGRCSRVNVPKAAELDLQRNRCCCCTEETGAKIFDFLFHFAQTTRRCLGMWVVALFILYHIDFYSVVLTNNRFSISIAIPIFPVGIIKVSTDPICCKNAHYKSLFLFSSLRQFLYCNVYLFKYFGCIKVVGPFSICSLVCTSALISHGSCHSLLIWCFHSCPFDCFIKYCCVS